MFAFKRCCLVYKIEEFPFRDIEWKVTFYQAAQQKVLFFNPLKCLDWHWLITIVPHKTGSESYKCAQFVKGVVWFGKETLSLRAASNWKAPIREIMQISLIQTANFFSFFCQQSEGIGIKQSIIWFNRGFPSNEVRASAKGGKLHARAPRRNGLNMINSVLYKQIRGNLINQTAAIFQRNANGAYQQLSRSDAKYVKLQ
jgi:hypothetical protein